MYIRDSAPYTFDSTYPCPNLGNIEAIPHTGRRILGPGAPRNAFYFSTLCRTTEFRRICCDRLASLTTVRIAVAKSCCATRKCGDTIPPNHFVGSDTPCALKLSNTNSEVSEEFTDCFVTRKVAVIFSSSYWVRDTAEMPIAYLDREILSHPCTNDCEWFFFHSRYIQRRHAGQNTYARDN